MRIVPYILALLVFGSILFVAFYPLPKKQSDKEQLIVQELIVGKIKLEIVISEQKDTIALLNIELATIRAEREEIFKASLEVASENYALNKVLEDMVVSMKQMFEYIKQLENQSRDRDA